MVRELLKLRNLVEQDLLGLNNEETIDREIILDKGMQHWRCWYTRYGDTSIDLIEVTYSHEDLGIEDLDIRNEIVDSIVNPQTNTPKWIK